MSRPLSSTFTSHPAEASLPPLRTSARPNPALATPVKPSPELDLHPNVGADSTAVNSHVNTDVHRQGQGQGQGNGTSTSFSVLRTQPGGSGFEDWEAEFETIFPLELEGRIQPSQLSSFLNAINAKETFNKVGLNVLSPRDVALQFLEIE
ncbi:hypothetical protein I307_01495 [Cryptococcus deuterogattii 99/473]|uniref:Uncharacterized protein n=1 Tax=Cryptococcus deuterogattii Ram5 TaxID=1296110 RepID=A0A0D0TUT0_9TREE|nr:hypothetical protein I313_04639 [Cryptococcus deuterogattii Ram5]KIR73949.1 hypothetical protein I310_02627 [Cryptococcus deuterogattii CA1014]KIY59243.1 hypothetical protein I307_01495 [Cryptococcus deuterogattii 99/473]